MLRKEMVSDKLDQLQLSVDRLKLSLVVPTDTGDTSTPVEMLIDQLQGIENQIEQVVNLIELEEHE